MDKSALRTVSARSYAPGMGAAGGVNRIEQGFEQGFEGRRPSQNSEDNGHDRYGPSGRSGGSGGSGGATVLLSDIASTGLSEGTGTILALPDTATTQVSKRCPGECSDDASTVI